MVGWFVVSHHASTFIGYLTPNPVYIYIYNHTSLSKHFWFLKNKGLTPEIEWSILRKSNTPNSFNGRCNLCLEEKIYILNYKWPDKLLNKRSELIARCRHKTKFEL